MEWRDEAIVLSVRGHGESSAILEALSAEHGRFAGLVRGASGKRLRGLLQPGNRLSLHWRARLSEHLGLFTVEDAATSIAGVLDDPLALSGLSAACALLSLGLPEREPHPRMAGALAVLIDQIHDPDIWPALYVRLEAGVLAELGYGLALDRCVATGGHDDLTHVSPRSGGAVCAQAAEPYLDKLMPLPGFLMRASAGISPGDIRNGLAITGYFLERRLLWPVNKELPQARERMLERLARRQLL